MQTFLSIGIALSAGILALALVDASTDWWEFVRRMWRQVCPLAR